MGIFAIPLIVRDVCYWNKRKPGSFKALFKEIALRRWCSLEVTAESL